jgi:hypothetical protein
VLKATTLGNNRIFQPLAKTIERLLIILWVCQLLNQILTKILLISRTSLPKELLVMRTNSLLLSLQNNHSHTIITEELRPLDTCHKTANKLMVSTLLLKE